VSCAVQHYRLINVFIDRDLKPENILLDATGHVALCDFGLSKADLRSDELTTTFCGTTEYLAPEVLLDEHGYSKLVDFWSLGVLLFEMCCGWSPFYAEDTQQMYKNICFGKIRFPKGAINEDGKQFVKGVSSCFYLFPCINIAHEAGSQLLNRNPKHRLGAQRDTAELKLHPFFKSIDWDALSLKQVTPPFKPVVESDESTSNFDPEFTSTDIRSVGFAEAELHLDEEDPSADWTAQSMTGSGFLHTPNGPLGCDKDLARTATATPLSPTHAKGRVGIMTPVRNGATAAQGIDVKRRKGFDVGSPLTSSVQENFKGFTFHGGESVVVPAHLLKRSQQEDEEAVDDEETQEVTTEDEYEDSDTPAGRYANARRKGQNLDDM
jgi:serine/threonine protein kinase SCH9